ncbi:MAG: Rrf2 family transcriptional regulator [Pseudomonadota bacterium]
MQLTRHTDYALRVLIFLALQPDKQLVTMADIERHFVIPRNHLIKIVQRLAKLGYAHTTRGKHGGVRLGRAPESIRIGDMVSDMETTLEVIDCNKPVCPLLGHCRLKNMLTQASQSFIDTLNRYTLSDIIAEPKTLETALTWNLDDNAERTSTRC